MSGTPDPPLLPRAQSRGHRRMLVRLTRLMIGLILFGVGAAAMVMAELGLAPWEVLHQGISERTGIPIGTVGIITGIFVLLGWIPLRERIGIGTLLNVVVIGVVIDLMLLIDYGGEPLWWRLVLMTGGVLLFGLGSAIYIGAGLGPGPRDGLMTGLARRGLRIGPVRIGIEVTVLVIGWLFGGTIGIGTVVYTFSVGPLVQLWLPRFTFDPTNAPAPPPAPHP